MGSIPFSHTGIRWVPAAISRHPALLAALGLSIGIFVGDKLEIDAGWILALSLVLGVVGVLLNRRAVTSSRIAGSLVFLFALIAFGVWRIVAANADRPSESILELTSASKRVEIFARVDGVPFQKQSGWRVPLDLIAVNGKTGDVPVNGRVLLTSIPTLQGLRFGDYIRFEGRAYAPSVQRNPGGFDYAEYLHRQGFDATIRPESAITRWPQDRVWSLYNLIDPVRQWIRVTFGKYLDDNPQALLVGLLLGDTDRLPKSIYDSFRESGTSHLLAVSGANVWLVVGMLLLPMYAFGVPRWPRTIVALAVVILFSFLTRNEPSVVRASLMVGLILFGQLLWRPVAPMNAVGAAAMIILLFAPSHLFRPGFQLSFAAVLGILIAVARVGPLLKGFWRRRWVYPIIMFLVASVSATLATAPVSAWHFGTVPVAGVVSNLFMVPLAGFTAHLGLALLPLQAVSATIATWLAWATGWLLSFSTKIAQFFATVPWAVVSWSSPSVFIMLHLLAVMILILNWRHRYHWLRPLAYYICLLIVMTAVVRLASPRQVHASLSLLDTGRQRVAVLSASDGSALGLIDDPGLDDEIDQWVIQPFLRHQIGAPSLKTWMPWRRRTGQSVNADHEAGIAIRWERFYSNHAFDSIDVPRIWADRWRGDTTTVFMIRDVPDFPVVLLTIQLQENRGGLTLILPAQSKPEWTREVVESVNPNRVILYGKSWQSRTPDEALELWRLRFPGISFYSSAVHGGVILDILDGAVPVISTLEESLARR